MRFTLWWHDHELEVDVELSCSAGPAGVIVECALDEIVAVRRCEDDTLLGPEETENLVRKHGRTDLFEAINRALRRQLQQGDPHADTGGTGGSARKRAAALEVRGP